MLPSFLLVSSIAWKQRVAMATTRLLSSSGDFLKKKNPFHSVFNFSFFSPFSGGGGAGFALDLVCVCVSVSVCLLGLCYRKPRSSLDYTVGRETVKAAFFLPSFTWFYRVLLCYTGF